MFFVISVYFNIRNTLPKSGIFLLGHPVYVYMYLIKCHSVIKLWSVWGLVPQFHSASGEESVVWKGSSRVFEPKICFSIESGHVDSVLGV